MISVSIKTKGLKEAQWRLIKLKSEFNTLLEELITEYVNGYLLERIRLNTPIRTGALRESIVLVKSHARGGKVKFIIESRLPYSLKIHEEEFNLGPVSQQQPPQPEGGVGNKFIERVINYHADDLKQILGSAPTVAVKKLFRSGYTRTLRRK